MGGFIENSNGGNSLLMVLLLKILNKPNAPRAVGTAIGSNPVAYLIPCHRVIQSSGFFGGYMWGKNRKAAIIGWEGAKINTDLEFRGL